MEVSDNALSHKAMLNSVFPFVKSRLTVLNDQMRVDLTNSPHCW